MDLLQIQGMLEKAYNLTFLEAIEMLSKERKKYEKSEFYKESRIPLLKLYESYFMYTQQRYGIFNKISDIIESIDKDLINEKVTEILETLSNNDSVNKFLNEIFEKFNMADLLEQNEELKELIKKVKP